MGNDSGEGGKGGGEGEGGEGGGDKGGADHGGQGEESGAKRRGKKATRRQEQMAREAAAAWLDDRMRTLDGRAIGHRLFMAPTDQRRQRAEEGLEAVRTLLAEADKADTGALEEATADAVLLSTHMFAAQAGTWLGADSWPTAIMTQATPPGFESSEVERVLLRDVVSQAVSAEEVREVVGAFVEATWGEESRLAVAEQRGFAGVMVSAPPQFAAIQYSIGVLWGYALRGLVLRLALDRALGTLPESSASARRRLERQLASLGEGQEARPPASGASTRAATGGASSSEASPTLLQYAAEFFGHADWAALCKPADATVAALEGELEEALPGLAMLAGAEDDEGAQSTALIGFDKDDDGEDGEMPAEEMIMLTQEEWEAFQRRSVGIGALLADAEALVDAEAGPLQRGRRAASKWTQQLVRSGALSGVRREHGSMLAGRLSNPAKRLAEVLRTDFLASKLRSARHGLERLYGRKTTAAE